MATLKCKICGGSVVVVAESGIYTCEYCGTKQSLPLFSEDSERLLYESGNNYLLHSEYDKAETVFNQLLTIRPDAPELYWNLVLCKFGVTYVKDPKNGKYVPTCNRTYYSSIFSDENYKKAIDLSSGEKKALFEADAATIDTIQKGIIAVSKKEKPFDIFISYKESDNEGNRTKDSIEAQELYEKLTEVGYKVFFSRITLENKVGTEYEPYIYAALHSSKVMLTVGSSKENLEAVWVKNEWSRFLALCQSDTERALIPLYFDMDRAELPEGFAILPSQDMHKEGFEQELLRGIKKLIPVSILRAKRRKELFRSALIGFVSVALVAGIVALVVVPKAMEKKHLAASEEAYQTALAQFEAGDYTAAAKAFSALGDYKDSVDQLARCAIQPEYDAAMALYEGGSYSDAAQAFAALGNYEDAAQMKEKAAIEAEKVRAYEAAMQLYYDSHYAAAAWAFRDQGEYKDAAAMQKKAESAWRDQLSGTGVSVYGYENPMGTYYISPNGQVENMIRYPGNLNEGIEIGKHGKIVSIVEGVPLCALYEDGFVYNSAKYHGMDADWENVIQITPYAALKTDGTVVYPEDEKWLEPVSAWKDMVSLTWKHAKDRPEGGLSLAILVGIDVRGDVHCVYKCDAQYADESAVKTAASLLNSMTNVKTISLCVISGVNYATQIRFAAIDNENNLIRGEKGATTTKETTHTDIMFDGQGELLVLDSKGTLKNLDRDTTVCEDVIYIDQTGWFVTRSGTLFKIEYYSVVNTEEKVWIRDVWLEGKR